MSDVEKTVTVTCPRCGAQGQAPIWDEIDAQATRRDARHVLNETLFEVKCNQCGNASSLDYPLVYHDGKNRFFVQYLTDAAKLAQAQARIRDEALRMKAKAARAAVIADKGSEQQADEAAREVEQDENALLGYRFRIVLSRNALREKVVVLRNGLDDRAVEVLKLTTFNLAKSQNKLHGATEPYFGGVKKSGDVIIDFVGGRRHRETKVPKELYMSVCADIDAYEAGQGGAAEELVIDRAWAAGFLSSMSAG